MTLQSSGPIKLSEIQTEFGGTNPISMSEYYGGGAYVPSGIGLPTSGTISVSQFYGKTKAQFTPDGGTSSGSAVLLESSGATTVSRTISCTGSATWTWSRTVGSEGGANVSSGGSATSITFTLNNNTNVQKFAAFTLSGTFGGVTRHWTINLLAEGFA